MYQVVNEFVINISKKNTNSLVEYLLLLPEKPFQLETGKPKSKNWPYKVIIPIAKLSQESKTGKKIYIENIVTKENDNVDKLV